MSGKISSLGKKILALLKNYTLSTREISQEIGATYATTLKYLEILNASLLVENIVYGKTKVWSLKKSDPFNLDVNTLLFLLIKTLHTKKTSLDLLDSILDSFYVKAIDINKEKLKNFSEIELIKRYLELERKLKWTEIEEYDIMNEDPLYIELKIFDCKYKFGCCVNLKHDNLEIYCMVGRKFPLILERILNLRYLLQLADFSIDPNFCIIKLKKLNSLNRK